MKTQWFKDRWKEARWGAFNYLVPFTAVINIILLASIDFNLTGIRQITFAIGLFSSFLLVATIIGRFHGKVQQKTDAEMEFGPIIDDIAERSAKKIIALMEERERARMEIENR